MSAVKASTARGAATGIPSSSTLAFDPSGILYLARNGRRYQGGEVEDLWPVYRVPLGGGRLGKAAEPRFLYGPPLPNPQVGVVRGGHELLVTTYDRRSRGSACSTASWTGAPTSWPAARRRAVQPRC